MGLRGPIGTRKQARSNSATEPAPPAAMDAASVAEWQRVTDLLRERGALDALDQTALRDYLLCWQRLRECEAEISRDGITIGGQRGRVKHPAAQLARQYRDSMLAWSKELGLTFASRARLDMAAKPPAKENKWERFGALGG